MAEYHPEFSMSKNERFSMEKKRINNKYEESQKEKSLFKNKYELKQQRDSEIKKAEEKIYGRSGGRGYFYD